MAGPVTYADAEPNGLAAMLGGLIEANLGQHPDRRALLRSRATYAVTAPDADTSVSIRLGSGAVTLRNGVVGRPDVHVTADSGTLIELASVPLRMGLPDVFTREGRAVVRKLVTRSLRVRGMLAHPVKLSRLNRVLSAA